MYTTKLLFFALAAATTNAYTLVVCQVSHGATIEDAKQMALSRRISMGIGAKGFWHGRETICPLWDKPSVSVPMFTFCRSDPYDWGYARNKYGGVVECHESGSKNWPTCDFKC
ncbi:uncharacterized protein RAG0_10457 [Rhynchosporium agropyri]|uniref:Uncharacterized protein n=1 Tax=Rhynchosporium agropyri TaxID=914238 RepID=A0A1E1KZZ8_9HELO|nr:uncharacterized protein RAG0_10457 [Rhynchosporium agropyri]